MRTLAWIGVGWLGTTVLTALGSRLAPAHVLPDMTVLVVVFLALRREPMGVALTAMVLGYLVGRTALAPVGLHEVTLVVMALGVYLVAGSISGSGALFYAMSSGLAVMGYHAGLFALMYWQRGYAGFASWSTAALVPTAFATFVLALMCYPFMVSLERRLTQDKREGLAWR